MAVSIDEAYLIGGWLASALWGAFSVLFCTSLYLIFAKRRGDLYKPTTYLMIILYLLATAHLYLAMARAIEGLIKLRDVPPGPVGYFANIAIPLNRAKDLIYITTMAIGDSVVVWRCYAVWMKHPWVVILPVLMVIGTAISGYGAIAQYFLEHPSLEVAQAWGTAMFSVSLATNVLVTLLTAGRIWWLAREHQSAFGSGFGMRSYRTVVLLVIESGAVIAAAKLIEFILFRIVPSDPMTGSHSLYILFDMMPQITGIMPTAIIFVVNAGLTVDNTYERSARSASNPSHRGVVVFKSSHTRFDGSRSGYGGVKDSAGASHTFVSSLGDTYALDPIKGSSSKEALDIPHGLAKDSRERASSSVHTVNSEMV